MATIYRYSSKYGHGTKILWESFIPIEEVEEKVKRLNGNLSVREILDKSGQNGVEFFGFYKEDYNKDEFEMKVWNSNNDYEPSQSDILKKEKPWHLPDDDDPIERWSRYD